MTQPAGLHHVAISTSNMKAQIEFFSDVLGMELVALYWMHGAKGCWHGFMRMIDDSCVAFVFAPGNENLAPQIGVTHAGHGAGASAPGTMQHLALNVATMADLLNMRDRIRSRGVNVIGPLDHGICQSMYFAGPENLTLEIATSDGASAPLDLDRTWIDPEVVALAGISAEELARYTRPEKYAGENGSLPQPPYDPAKPHTSGPVDRYKATLAIPDDVFKARFSETTPPHPHA
ncbi:VOC family protein [uncultured Sphingomonas sp.]|uniref:VOC family protein n=1 Tax=uncultured Sphingomonas sp. TaxID=158754 RepID=UPI0026079C1C|nr:VOC family protein [uncultured Sphingomonas sp.]